MDAPGLDGGAILHAGPSVSITIDNSGEIIAYFQRHKIKTVADDAAFGRSGQCSCSKSVTDIDAI
jgi:hypothetical protein